MDERLPLFERTAMAFHVAICRNCARFVKQLHAMRQLIQGQSSQMETTLDDALPGLSPESRQRIKTELQKNLDA
ncbi:MAG: hypothetical protein ABL892_02995 [Thiobacillaceae bacterium]